MKGGGDMADGPRKAGTVDADDGTVVTIGGWIDGRERPVPVEFRPHLSAGGAVSLDALLAAAEREVAGCAVESPRDRRAAFSLLAADAYVTYACTLAMMEEADASTLRGAARRIAHGWWDGLR